MDQNSQTTSQNTGQGPAHNASDNTASFGFRAVPETERQGLVNKVFASVAGRYDLMNDLMSGGLHRLWKRELITMLNAPRGATPFKLLDVAGGTGDISIRYANDSGPNATAVICDISPEMLEVGRRRIADAGLQNRIQCVEGNAEELPFESSSFDAYTIAFGIRNVTHIDRALAEAYRVLKPGGRFLCLEFSECRVPVLDRLYDFHSFEIIPRLGQLTAGDAESYRYLVESIRRFPTQEKFAELVRNAGFSRVSYRNLTGGIAAIHGGWKI
ncbi:bifunctional demethylmenaquinone methyltransferase/2-methoxy-6-polyprenyl-1,4-benzoquinol methylase UbiE [Hyphomicrobium sp. ghe19]|uniref:bifunctional demethylmenaquinone methyltransferase/2-methoxy-6-polyprenyl-1,4-benzoquinol methylase UbiE n=1 Tax=Hyphomicrobium sp. ghe19 TaxID=2682968 RepID=UPI0013673225|nr:Ubiquinone/menaquinone biosynthesis C-methyltransferase UbiE [Hyphomicrobium sp. ghe19]